jgi:hypothetical protein
MVKSHFHITTTRNYPDGTDEEISAMVANEKELKLIFDSLVRERNEGEITSFILVLA